MSISPNCFYAIAIIVLIVALMKLSQADWQSRMADMNYKEAERLRKAAKADWAKAHNEADNLAHLSNEYRERLKNMKS